MSRLTRSLRAWVRRVDPRPAAAPATPIERYLAAGRKPWTNGYAEYRIQFTLDTLRNFDVMERFRSGQRLPGGYGTRLDERVVEYPWVLSHLPSQPGILFDAGGTLGFRYLLDLPALSPHTIHVCSLTRDSEMAARPNVAYLCADLRQAPVRDAVIDNVICISTLEHVGMDNTQVYAAKASFRENRPESYRVVIQEFQRILAPGGRLYLTVPYGKYEQHGWLQQFDLGMVEDVISAFGGHLEELTFFRYTVDGWQLATMAECSTAQYYDIHRQKKYEPDYAAAARAVACITLVKRPSNAAPGRAN
jgi:SAM-dependent methyltransferase